MHDEVNVETMPTDMPMETAPEMEPAPEGETAPMPEGETAPMEAPVTHDENGNPIV